MVDLYKNNNGTSILIRQTQQFPILTLHDVITFPSCG